jgi:hypothetical protein
MYQHQPRCPQSWEPGGLAARIVADQPEQGWSLLCNGVVLFEDESAAIASVAAQRARENRDYVRTLLARKQPEFARALTSAEQELVCQAVACRTGSRIARAAAPMSGRQ